MFDGLGLKAVLDHHRRKLARELAWVEQITELKTFFFVVQLRSDISVFAEIIFDVQERESSLNGGSFDQSKCLTMPVRMCLAEMARGSMQVWVIIKNTIFAIKAMPLTRDVFDEARI